MFGKLKVLAAFSMLAAHPAGPAAAQDCPFAEGQPSEVRPIGSARFLACEGDDLRHFGDPAVGIYLHRIPSIDATFEDYPAAALAVMLEQVSQTNTLGIFTRMAADRPVEPPPPQSTGATLTRHAGLADVFTFPDDVGAALCLNLGRPVAPTYLVRTDADPDDIYATCTFRLQVAEDVVLNGRFFNVPDSEVDYIRGRLRGLVAALKLD